MTSLSPAEQLLQELGITEADEIDVEVIACPSARGFAIARCRKVMHGSSAWATGPSSRSMIGPSRVRQRFSVAHELGHWHHHRGQRLICHDASWNAQADTCEREADHYAANY